MKQLMPVLFLLFLSINTHAQTLSIEKVQKATVLRNSNAIKEGSEVKGYYFFYVTDKIDRKTNEYVLQILDANLNKLKELRFQDSKYLQVLESSFNGTDLVFLFYNSDTNIMEYQVYGANGDKKFSYTKSLSRRDEMYLKTTYLNMNDDDNNYKGLYPVEGKGFISNIPSRDNKDYTFEISYIGTNAKKQWSYVPNMDGKIFVGDYLGTFNGVVFVEMLRYSSTFDRNPESIILGLSMDNGKLLFQKNTAEGKYSFYPVSMSFLNDGKAYIYGEYFDKGGNVMKDKSKGFGFWDVNEQGKLLSEKYVSWNTDLGKYIDVTSSGKIDDFGYMFLHNMVQTEDGNVFAIGEGFKKAASALGIASQLLTRGSSGVSTVKLKVTDMIVIKFDKDFNVKGATVYKKQDNDILLESGSEFVSTPMLGKYVKYYYGGFDYAYTQMSNDHSTFSVCYSDYERNKEYSGATFNSISYNEGKFTQDKIHTKTSASKSIVFPARPGQVLIADYYRKDKRLDLHFEKLN